jgi:hypothetical protein
MSLEEVQAVVDIANKLGGVLGVRFVSTDEDELPLWLASPSGKKPTFPIDQPLPPRIELVLGTVQIDLPQLIEELERILG